LEKNYAVPLSRRPDNCTPVTANYEKSKVVGAGARFEVG